MLVAMTGKEMLVYASEVSRLDLEADNYYCPKCHKAVFLKKSVKGKPFFSHLIECEREVTRMKPLETKEHVRGKEIIMNELSEIEGNQVQSELFFPEMNQFADVYIKQIVPNLNRAIYEFQRSVIPAHELYMRNFNYEEEVDHVHWLLDYQSTKSNKLNQRWMQTMLNYSTSLGFHWKSLDLKTKAIVLKFNLPLLYQSESIQYNEIWLPIKKFQAGLDPIIKKSSIIKKKEKVRKNKHPMQIMRAYMTNASYREDIYLLYQEGVVLSDLPDWIFNENWQLLICKTPGWLVIGWSIVLLKNMSLKFTQKDFATQLRHCDRIRLAELPLISVDVSEQLAEEILRLFTHKNILHEFEDGWSINNMQHI